MSARPAERRRPAGAPAGSRPGLAARALLAPIAAYRRFLSPLKPAGSCRFHPTCSAYAADAVRLHGAARGSWLALRRVARCHPFHPGGLDPVPPPASRTEATRDAPAGGAAPEEP